MDKKTVKAKNAYRVGNPDGTDFVEVDFADNEVKLTEHKSITGYIALDEEVAWLIAQLILDNVKEPT